MNLSERRDNFAKGLSPLYLPKYEIMCAALGPEWQPYFGFRSILDQERLYAEGRSAGGDIVTDARGGESPHNYGCATDWTIFENNKPIWMGAKDIRWEKYKSAIRVAGLYWGGDFPGHFQDIDHNELKISVSWSVIKRTFDILGLDDAIAEIKRSII